MVARTSRCYADRDMERFQEQYRPPEANGSRVEENDTTVLDAFFRAALRHQRSNRLPENDAMHEKDAERRYHEVMEDYEVPSEEIDTYNREHPGEEKEDYKSANTGWKVHLNVAPDAVRTVSEYLRSKGYVHKYLSGGEAEDGKVFTIYIGSFALTRKLSEEMGKDLAAYLSRPADGEPEIELAPGVIGRFTVGDNAKFHRYGSCGFSLLMDDMRRGARIKERDEQRAFFRQAEARAFRALREAYGMYFFPSSSTH